MSNTRYRRLFGTVFGLVIGLTYGLGSQGINHMLMPGVPLYHPLFGFWGNVALATSIATVLGAVTAWPLISAWGVVWGSVLGALLISAVSLPNPTVDPQIFWLQACCS